MSMIEMVKRIAIAAVESRNPVNVLLGTVETASPLEIQIHQKLKLTKEFLIVTQTVSNATLVKGDKLVLLRVQGGQQFVVLDKVVS
jgi:hypothetical protein